ncbi:MAG: hypothetical protein MUE30_09715 [Spirosomaceae bacterium]|jgi:hypothetical protein|nr:hypothetical protein [Spirosomataceae bacterium]
MSLDTVLKIGKVYRYSKQGLEQHRYINAIWKDVEAFKKNKDAKGKALDTIFYRLPVLGVEGTFVFDFDHLSETNDQDFIRTLKYLNFKTSDKDSEKRYLFGDVIYATYMDKKGIAKENGNYRMEKPNKGTVKPSSFWRAEEDAESLQDTIVGGFRKAFEQYIEQIETLLRSAPAVVLHFDFHLVGENLQWYELEGVQDLINQKLVQGFIKEHKGTKKTVLEKFLFKTIGGINPNFDDEASYKVKAFESPNEVIDLMYGVSIAEKPVINVRDFGIVVLPDLYLEETPDFNNIANILDSFLQKRGLTGVVEGEDTLDIENQELQQGSEENDSMFSDLIDNELPEEVKYDIVFLKPAGLSSPSVDMVEISSVAKSKLREIHETIVEKKNALGRQSDRELVDGKGNKLKLQPKYDIKASFLEILGQKGKNQKKYSFHLLKVLPQIYTDTYYQDPILLPALIEKVERNIRDDFSNFNVLKYDFQFLIQIQKFDAMNAITNSKSYAMGIALGKMARPFAAWRDDSPIKSFEKNYVGNLSKRITNLLDLTKFSNFMNEKLTIHEKNHKEQQSAYLDLMTNFKSLQEGSEKYDRNACALGFFESYFFRSEPKTETQNQQ